MTETEVHLCERVRDWLERLGFDVYPEVGGWDLVATTAEPRRIEKYSGRVVRPGEQVGFHAKLRASCQVLAQAIPPPSDGLGYRYPRWPYVVAPSPGVGFRIVARHLGIGVVDAAPERARRRRRRTVSGALVVDPEVVVDPGYAPGPKSLQLDLPPIASRAIVAGAPSPRSLSKWRIGALRFLIWARRRETYAPADLDGFGINRRWAERWGELVRYEPRANRAGRSYNCPVYRLTERAGVLPDAGYRDVLTELEAAES